MLRLGRTVSRPRRRGDDRVEHRVRPSCSRPRPRPLPAPAAPRSWRLRLRLARPGRAHRARGRAQDRPPRGEARLAGGARDGSGFPAPPRALRPGLRLRRRQRPRLHRLRVRPGQHAARDAPLRQDRRPGCYRGGGADPRRARARPPARHRPPRRQALERARRGIRAISIRLLDFGLAQFDEADTLTAVGDVPGTLAYIAPERLRGGDATAASDVWAVGVVLWEALVGEHPFWGVPLPQVAAAIEAGAKPLGSARADLPPEVIAAVSSALTIEPSKRPSAERLAAALRTALTSPRRDRSKAARPHQVAAAPEGGTCLAPARAPTRILRARGGHGHLRRRADAVLAARARASARARHRGRNDPNAAHRPRNRPLRARVPAREHRPGGRRRPTECSRLRWLAVFWRDARAGLLFVAGPLLAAIGAIALLPLAVQPAHGRAEARAAGVRGRARRRRRRRPARPAAPAHRLARPESRRRRLDARHRRDPGTRGRGQRQRRARNRRARARSRGGVPSRRAHGAG